MAILVATLGTVLTLAVGATFTVPPASAATANVRINAGGPVSTVDGASWQADRYSVGGRPGSTKHAIGGASTRLYQAYRIGPRGYDIPLPSGSYDVTVLAAETFWNSAGKRIFSASAEGAPMFVDLDLYRAVGHNKPWSHTARVTVTDGTLNLGFSAQKDNALVAGVSVVPVGSPAPAPTPSASWQAPALVNPIVWTPSATNRKISAPADRDVVVAWPSAPLDVVGGLEINGGRNVVSVGGTVRPSKKYFSTDSESVQVNRNRCLHITGSSSQRAPRTVHVEGLHCAGQYIWKGINIDSKGEKGTLTVQFRDITIDRVNVDLPGGLGHHYGGDALQTWNGPHRLLIDGFTASNLEYQGLFLQPNSFGSGAFGRWQLENIHLSGDPQGHAYLLWLAGDRTGSNAIPISTRNLRVTPAPGRSAERTVWELAKDWTDITVG